MKSLAVPVDSIVVPIRLPRCIDDHRRVGKPRTLRSTTAAVASRDHCWVRQLLFEVATSAEDNEMLYTLAIVLVILWALGFLAFHVGGGIIHLLLVIAVIAVLLRIIQGRRPI